MSWLSLNSLHLSKCSPILSLINDPRIAPSFLKYLVELENLALNTQEMLVTPCIASLMCVSARVFLATFATTFQNPKSAYFILKVEIFYISFPEKEQSTSIKEMVNQIFYAWITEVSCHYKSLSFGWKEKDNFQDVL